MFNKISIVVVLAFVCVPSEVCASDTQVCTVSKVTSLGLRAAVVGIYALPIGVGVALCQFVVARNRLRSLRAPFYNASTVKILDGAKGITYSVPVDTKTMESHVIAYLKKNNGLRVAPDTQAYLYTTHDVIETPIGEGYAIKGAMVDYLSDTFRLKIW